VSFVVVVVVVVIVVVVAVAAACNDTLTIIILINEENWKINSVELVARVIPMRLTRYSDDHRCVQQETTHGLS
jgi:hypothetical protein